MKRLVLVLPVLLLAACPSGPAGPVAGYDVVAEAKAWTREADADWADNASAEIIRLGRLTAANVLDLAPGKAEGVCRLLAHLDHADARKLLLEIIEHPDAKSGFYRPFVFPAATIAWTRAVQTGKVASIAPLVERLEADARTLADYRWFDTLASAVEAAAAREALPALRESAERLGVASVEAAERLGVAPEQAPAILNRRVLLAHTLLNDPGALDLAKTILEGEPKFESGDALRYLDRQEPEAGLAAAEKILLGAGPKNVALTVIHRHGGPRTEELKVMAAKLEAELPAANRRFLTWFGQPPAWEPPRELRENPNVAQFLIRNGIGNRMKYLRLWIQPVLTHSKARWFGDEQSVLAQHAELAALFSEPIPHLWDAQGVPDPYGVWEGRLGKWWESVGHRLMWKKAKNRYAP